MPEPAAKQCGHHGKACILRPSDRLGDAGPNLERDDEGPKSGPARCRRTTQRTKSFTQVPCRAAARICGYARGLPKRHSSTVDDSGRRVREMDALARARPSCESAPLLWNVRCSRPGAQGSQHARLLGSGNRARASKRCFSLASASARAATLGTPSLSFGPVLRAHRFRAVDHGEAGCGPDVRGDVRRQRRSWQCADSIRRVRSPRAGAWARRSLLSLG
jgi:hypothetical protein